MGNENSQIEKFTDAVLANFDNFQKVEDHEVQSVYGKCQLFQRKIKLDEYILCKKISIGNEERQKHIQQFLEKRMQIQHPNLLKFYGYSLCKQNNFCSTNYSFNAYYEYHRISLLQENNNRQNNEEIYQLNELWYMAKSLLSLSEYLQENDEVHPNIHPSTIFLTESGQLKLIDSTILSLNSPSQKVHQNQTESNIQSSNNTLRYISPEEVVNLKNMNKFKVSIFQIGMTLLESALIQDCSYIYLEDDSINQNSLDFLLNKVQEIYGDSFTTFLKKVLHLNPNNRLDIKEATQIQLKSSENRNKNLNYNSIVSDFRGDDGSPAPRNMRLNSSIINKGVIQNQFVNSFINNNDNTGRMSNKNSQAQSYMIKNLQNNHNYISDQKNKYYSESDYNIIKSPSSFHQRTEQVINSPYTSKLISIQNSPTNRSSNTIDDKIQTQGEQIRNNGTFSQNFYSFSNTVDKNNELSEIENKSNSNIIQSKVNTVDYKNQQLPSQQIIIQDNINNQKVKFIESNIKVQNQSSPKSPQLIQGNGKVKQAYYFIEKQNNLSSSQYVNNDQVFIYPQSPQSQTIKDLNPIVQQLIEKNVTQTLSNQQILNGQKQINVQQQIPLNSSIQQQYETKQNNKLIENDPSQGSTTLYKIYYSRNNSPQNESQINQTKEIHKQGQLSSSNQLSLQKSNILEISNQEQQNKPGNYYSNSNNVSFSQNSNPSTQQVQNNYPLIVQTQKKYMFQTPNQKENSLERSKLIIIPQVPQL